MAEWEKVKALEESIRKAFESTKSRESMQRLGDSVADRVRTRTRLGKGVDSLGASPKALKKLSKRYIKQRKEDGNLSSETSPGRSNLTRTGQLLDSIKATVKAEGQVEVSATGTRSGGLSNEKLSEYVTDAGRPFLNLSKPEIRGILDAIRNNLVDRINSLLKS